MKKTDAASLASRVEKILGRSDRRLRELLSSFDVEDRATLRQAEALQAWFDRCQAERGVAKALLARIEAGELEATNEDGRPIVPIRDLIRALQAFSEMDLPQAQAAALVPPDEGQAKSPFAAFLESSMALRGALRVLPEGEKATFGAFLQVQGGSSEHSNADRVLLEPSEARESDR